MAYIILEINTEVKKEVLNFQIGDNESSKYWPFCPKSTEKPRSKKRILRADGLSRIKKTIAAAFAKTEYQRCIVLQEIF